MGQICLENLHGVAMRSPSRELCAAPERYYFPKTFQRRLSRHTLERARAATLNKQSAVKDPANKHAHLT